MRQINISNHRFTGFAIRLSSRNRFNCACCNYSAVVEGGPVRKMDGNYQTCKCNGCNNLVDVKVWERKPGLGFARKEEFDNCGHCGSDNLVAWYAERGECPRCSESYASSFSYAYDEAV